MDEVIEESIKKYQGLVPFVYDLEIMSLVEALPQDMPYAVYLKREADKVIADKDAKILALDAEVAKQKHHAKLFFDERNYAEARLRHHKYHRCLDMAAWCKAEADAAFLRYNWDSGRYAEVDFYEKWHKRWLEIATKFKEAGND